MVSTAQMCLHTPLTFVVTIAKKNKNIWTYFWLYSNQCVSGWGKQKVQISFKNTLNIRLWYKKNGYGKKPKKFIVRPWLHNIDALKVVSE